MRFKPPVQLDVMDLISRCCDSVQLVAVRPTIATSASANNWTSVKPSSVSIDEDTTDVWSTAIYELELKAGDDFQKFSTPIKIQYALSNVRLTTIQYLYTPNDFNTSNICMLNTVAFNGVGLNSDTVLITRSNIATYVKKMWRLKR